MIHGCEMRGQNTRSAPADPPTSATTAKITIAVCFVDGALVRDSGPYIRATRSDRPKYRSHIAQTAMSHGRRPRRTPARSAGEENVISDHATRPHSPTAVILKYNFACHI